MFSIISLIIGLGRTLKDSYDDMVFTADSIVKHRIMGYGRFAYIIMSWINSLIKIFPLRVNISLNELFITEGTKLYNDITIMPPKNWTVS